MAATSLLLWLGLFASAGVISLGVLWCLGRLTGVAQGPATIIAASSDEARYLFNGDLMFDHDAGALPAAAHGMSTWQEMRDWLDHRFEDLPHSLADLAEGTPLLARTRAPGDGAQMCLLRTPHSTSVTLSDPPYACPAERHDMLTTTARMTDITDTFGAAPHPIWKTGTDGTILWRNTACEAAFDPATQVPADVTSGMATAHRFSVTPDQEAEREKPRWYETRTTVHHWGALHYATDITQVVSAEKMQKDFVQTLTKTFAYLTTGLAVFDRNRKLALFNPALVDLTSLGAEFLITQPDLLAFFDCLRDRRVMPEPRSYASWRTKIGEVIDAAEGGLYQETWSLPNDVTYRVTGRPHPDGAVAFLFEDISAEVMLARRFRSQVELRQSALDSLPEAVMVIGSDNVLAFCNTAATRMLRIDPDTCFADMTVPDLIRACADALPTPDVWSNVENSLHQRQPDAASDRWVAIAPGQTLDYRIDALPGGVRMLMLRGHSGAVATATEQLAAG
jgi:PAS domain-containing protein